MLRCRSASAPEVFHANSQASPRCKAHPVMHKWVGPRAFALGPVPLPFGRIERSEVEFPAFRSFPYRQIDFAIRAESISRIVGFRPLFTGNARSLRNVPSLISLGQLPAPPAPGFARRWRSRERQIATITRQTAGPFAPTRRKGIDQWSLPLPPARFAVVRPQWAASPLAQRWIANSAVTLN